MRAEAGRVIGRHQRAGRSDSDQLAIPAYICRNDRQAGGHGLQYGIGDSLGLGWQHEDIEATQKRGDIVSLARQP